MRSGHGVVVWFTGLPASGKTTLAANVSERLARVLRCVVLDSDQVRDVLGVKGYRQAERDDFYAVLGRIAVMLAQQGHVVLVAATAPRRSYRDDVRRATAKFVEVYVATTREDAEARDRKGLYARARAGQAPTLPGLGADYEAPTEPEVIAHGGLDADAAREIEAMVLLMHA
jgi:adenylylsulfate kinase